MTRAFDFPHYLKSPLWRSAENEASYLFGSLACAAEQTFRLIYRSIFLNCDVRNYFRHRVMATEPPESSGFSPVLTSFTASLTQEQNDDFKYCTLDDLKVAIDAVQKKQASEKKMRNLARLKSFLDAMEQYGKIREIFLNTSNIIAYIWVSHNPSWKLSCILLTCRKGPTKFLLQVPVPNFPLR